jgi:hypothetical protein
MTSVAPNRPDADGITLSTLKTSFLSEVAVSKLKEQKKWKFFVFGEDS